MVGVVGCALRRVRAGEREGAETEGMNEWSSNGASKPPVFPRKDKKLARSLVGFPSGLASCERTLLCEDAPTSSSSKS